MLTEIFKIDAEVGGGGGGGWGGGMGGGGGGDTQTLTPQPDSLMFSLFQELRRPVSFMNDL